MKKIVNIILNLLTLIIAPWAAAHYPAPTIAFLLAIAVNQLAAQTHLVKEGK